MRVLAIYTRIHNWQIKPVPFGDTLNRTDDQLRFMSGTGRTGKIKCYYDGGYLAMVF